MLMAEAQVITIVRVPGYEGQTAADWTVDDSEPCGFRFEWYGKHGYPYEYSRAHVPLVLVRVLVLFCVRRSLEPCTSTGALPLHPHRHPPSARTGYRPAERGRDEDVEAMNADCLKPMHVRVLSAGCRHPGK
eukprot:scaffold94598_cov13-Prasinocladus_malaysianus.AAC.1